MNKLVVHYVNNPEFNRSFEQILFWIIITAVFIEYG